MKPQLKVLTYNSLLLCLLQEQALLEKLCSNSEIKKAGAIMLTFMRETPAIHAMIIQNRHFSA